MCGVETYFSTTKPKQQLVCVFDRLETRKLEGNRHVVGINVCVDDSTGSTLYVFQRKVRDYGQTISFRTIAFKQTSRLMSIKLHEN